MTIKQLALVICLFIVGSFISPMLSKNKVVEQVKNCNRHGGVETVVIKNGTRYHAAKYTVTCKDWSAYSHE